MDNNNLQEMRIMAARGDIPKEIIDLIYQLFSLVETRAKVGDYKSVSFEVRTRERNHVVPHIHASYDNYSISIEIETGRVLAGNLPKKQQKIAVDWVLDNKSFLLGKWQDYAFTAVSLTTTSMLGNN